MGLNPLIVELVELGNSYGGISMSGLTRQEMHTEFKRLADKTRKGKIFKNENKTKNYKTQIGHND